MNSNSTQPEISDVQKSIIRNNYKLTADKIIQILKNLRNNAHLSNRRWVWELMQNAKDVTNAFDRVSIDIRLTPDSLSFRHNGDPFHIENITGLIQQVSSKASDSSDEEITGKFGTGFISTHLLANVIEVAGVVKRANDQHRQFTLTLDRSGTTSEALLGSISKSLDRILYLDHNEVEFPLLPTYAQERQETDLHTEFCYVLHEEENHEAARAGIADLVHTLPGTLLNIPRLKIKEVRVCQPDGTAQTYQVTKNRTEGAIAWYTVSVHDSEAPASSERYYLAYETDELRLLAEVTDFESLTLVPHTGEQPVLYRDFPLIGSEKFHFPFALNGFDFFPTEPRDSIFLNGKGDEPTRNRALVESAQAAALDFTTWLLTHNARNRFVLANTRLPEANMDTAAITWYKALQAAWRKELLDLPLVETESENGLASLAQVRIPRLRPNAKQEDNDALWALAVDFLGADAVPRRTLHPAWIKALGIEDELLSWSRIIFLDPTDLLHLVADYKTLSALPMGGGEHGSEEASVAWLNKLYAYLAEQNQLGLLKDIAAVPNQQGDLCILDKLFVERADELIPAPILSVLHELGMPWRDELLRRDILLPGYTHQDRGLREASAEINRVLKEKENSADTLESAFLKRTDAQQTLVDLLRLTSPSADDATYRSQLFRFAQDLLHFEEDTLGVESLKYFDFGKVAQLMTLHLNQTISDTKDLSELAAVLHRDSVGGTRMWLGSYLRFLANSTAHKQLLEFGNIVPNQLDKLCPYAELYNAGTRDQPLDESLLTILKECDSNQDWKPRLLADGIGLELPRRFTFDELGNALTTFANLALASEDYKQHLKPLLHLLEWCRKSEDNKELAKKYLGKFYERLSGHWFTLTMEGSGKGDKVMSLLHNPDHIDDLVAIAQSGANVAMLRQVAQLTKSDGVLTQVLRFVKKLESEVASFAFLQSIGAEMEYAFQQALEDAGVTASIERGEGTTASVAQIDYQGIGSYDFAVRNPGNGKAFYVELKSYKEGNPHPIRLAQSQAKRAARNESPFALCVIGRDRPADEVDAEYVRQHLGYVKDLHQEFAPVVEDINKLEVMDTAHDSNIWLDVSELRRESKVFVTHEFIQSRQLGFDVLIADILAAIQ